MISIDDYLSWDATAMGELVRAGEVTAAELEAACRERIAAVDPLINAMADVVRPAIADPAADGPFAGVPFAVKELLPVPGLPWTMGSRLLAGNQATERSPYVARLLGAGLRIVGSTTSSEFGLLGSTESALRGITANPWRAGVSAGGSSGGSAAAVAAGIVPIAHASDAGGSIRYPASMNGLFGLMPSAGRCVRAVPSADGLAALVVEHAVSRTVRDSAALLAVTERHDANAPHPPIGRIAGPSDRRLRVATIRRTLLGAEPDPDVAAALERTRALCIRLGHEPVDVEPPAIDGAALSAAFFTAAALTMAGMAAAMTPLLGRPPGPDELEPFTLELIERAVALPADAAARAERAFIAASAAYSTLFERCDVVLSPTVSRPPWPLGMLAPGAGRDVLIRRTGELVGYTPIHNVAGCPAMSVPLEWVDGLPVGMLFAAAPGADATLLALGFELEAAQPWAGRRPAITGATCRRS